MAYEPIPVENLAGGINLRDQPNLEVPAYALDCLDVDFDGPTVRTRDGFTQQFAGTGTEQYVSLFPYYTAGGARHLICVAADGTVRALNTGSSSLASIAETLAPDGQSSAVVFGGELETSLFLTTGTSAPPSDDTQIIKWNGSAFVDPIVWTGPITPKPYYLAVTPWDNRMVGAAFGGTQGEGNNFTTVRFSEPGDPLNWQDNYVDLNPGDGDRITGIIAWREYVFVFKRTKFYIFYGTSVGADGNPEFNYRTVNTGIGALCRPCALSDGVYFVSQQGIFRTTGGEPESVSGVLDPMFHHQQTAFSDIEPVNFSDSKLVEFRMAPFRNQLVVVMPHGNSDRLTWNYDPRTSAWVPWSIEMKAVTAFRPGSDEDLVFSRHNASDYKVYRMAPNYTDDNGTPIASFWQSGWITGGTEFRKQLREWKLWGSGTITFSVYDNYRTAPQTTDTVAFGNVPVAQKLSRKANRGHAFSIRAEGTAQFRLSKAVGHLREVSIPWKIS